MVLKTLGVLINMKNQLPHQHFALFKPYGYLSQFVNNQTTRKNKKLLGTLYNFPHGTMAIGRLDYPSEGLLLLTTDGKMSNYIRSEKLEKQYFVQVDGKITKKAINQLRKGVNITVEGKTFFTKKAVVTQIETPTQLPERAKKIRDERHGETSWVSITIKEGKYRQVRKTRCSADRRCENSREFVSSII